MFKNLISPVQAWLLSKGQCVGCGMPLANGTVKKLKGQEDQITCKCGRIFMENNSNGKYRRALIEEVT